MPITIGSNISSLKTQRQIARASEALSTTYERLASGQRINKASDDAAGLSVASSLNARARVYSQAIRNTSDGISLLNIAEGAVSQLSSIVTRQTELAEQAANGTYSNRQRAALHKEALALSKEYNRILETTEFNGVKVLTSSSSPISIQQGYGSEQSTQFAVGSALGPTAGDGTFGSAVTALAYIGGFRTPELVDLNNDNLLDVVTTSGDGYLWAGVWNGSTFSGTFGAPIAAGTTTTADYNGDGNADIAIFDQATGNLNVFNGNGNGTFSTARSFVGQDPLNFSFKTQAVDLNGDNALDIVNVVAGQTKITVMMNDGQGQFSKRDIDLGFGLININLADLNDDGTPDLIASDGDAGRGVQTYLGTGSGTFASVGSFAGSNRSIQVGDFNNDGKLDLVGTNIWFTNHVDIRYGNGDGTFSSILTVASPVGTVGGLTLGNYNGDQYLDFILDNTNDVAAVYLSNGNGSFRIATTFGLGAIAGSPLSSGDVNGDGITDFAYNDGSAGSGTIKIRLGNADPTGRVNPFQIAVDLRTQGDARTALTTLGANLTRISQELGNIGAFRGRLEVSQRVLAAARENYLLAESRIKDADIGEESSTLIRTQILQQSASAVLVQANLNPQLVLKLLQS